MARRAAILAGVLCVLVVVALQWLAFFAAEGGSRGPALAQGVTVGPGTPTVTPRPTSQAPKFITNNSGEPASYLLLAHWGAAPESPPDCGEPILVNEGPSSSGAPGRTLTEYLWATACIDPGEKVFIDLLLGGPTRVWDYAFHSQLPTYAFSNTHDLLSGRALTVAVAAFDGFTVEQPSGCSEPSFLFKPTPDPQGAAEQVTVAWDVACVGPGEAVVLHFMRWPVGNIEGNEWLLQLAADVSCDYETNAIDGLLVLQLGVGLLPMLPCGDGDADQDGDADSIDALLILQYVAGLLT